MKKRRYRDFPGRASANDRETTQGNPRRPYSGRVSGSGLAENPARRELCDDGDADRQPLKPSRKTHLSGDLRQCESLSTKFQWDNLLAQNPNTNPDPGFDPRNIPGLSRPELDYREQYGRFDHGGFTSPLPKSNLGPQENVDHHIAPGTVYSSSIGLNEGFRCGRDEYSRSSAMAELPIGHGGMVDCGSSSIGNEGFCVGSDELYRSREIGHGGCSQGQILRHSENVDSAGSSEASNEGLRSRSSAMADGSFGRGGYVQGQQMRFNELVDYGGSSIVLSEGFRGEFNRSRELSLGDYSQGQTTRYNEVVDNAASSEALNEGAHDRSRAMAEGPVGHAGYSEGQTPTHINGSSPLALSDGFRVEYNRTRAMAGGFREAMPDLPNGHGGYSRAQTTGHNELVHNAGSSEASNEGLHSSRAMAERPVGLAGYSQGQAPTHINGSSPLAFNEGFCASDEVHKSRAMAEALIGHGGYSHGIRSTMGQGPVSHVGYSQGLAPRPNNGNLPIALNEGFRGPFEFNKSREMAEGPVGHGGYYHGQTPRKNELVQPMWAQQSPKEEMGRDYMVPGMKRNENADRDAMFLLDLLYKKIASVGEDRRSPTHLRPGVTESVVQRVGGSKGSVEAGTHENCHLDQYHDYMEPSQPTYLFPNHQSTSEPSIPSYDEVLGSSNSRTEVCSDNEAQGFRLGVDVEVEPLSNEGNLQTLALPDEDQDLLEAYGGRQQRLAAAKILATMTPVKRWALKKKAMKEQQSGNLSKSMFFPDLNPSSNVLSSTYEVDIPLTTAEDMQQQYADEDIQQYAATCGEDQWNMEQNVISGDDQWNNIDHGDDQWNINQGVTCRVDERNTAEGSIDQDVTCRVDQKSVAQGVTFGENQCNIQGGVISGGDHQNNDQGVRTCEEQPWRMNYGEDQWNAEHINYLNTDSLLPNSELPASMQEHYSKQSKSARIHVKERLGPLKTGSIKTRLGRPIKSHGIVKMRLGPSPNDPSVNILACKYQELYNSPIRKTDDFCQRIHPQEDGFPKYKIHAATRSIHSLGTALPQVKTDGFSGRIHPHGGGLSKLKADVTGIIHTEGKAIPNVKKGDINETIRPQRGNENLRPQGGNEGIRPQGGSLTEVDVSAAKTEPPEDSKEFKQLVDDAFIKFIKTLIENPTERRKFMEGRGGKCCVCASSNEFVETAALARHAFMSPKVGFRAEHLGFHKALCVLLGWDCASVSNGRWVQQTLTDAETLTLKEDHIIWPPVVVIHNISVVNKNPEDERMTVNVEGLEAILRGMGIVGRKTNMCRGNPADGSVMVVKFQPTFSGLQEAERLHKLFADNKHGKAEWRNISSIGISNIKSGKQDDVANCLYGFLGNAEDWNELDLKSKKHFGVKSKKQIKAIANASL